MLYEQAHARAERERVRADAAEARAEELRWAEVAARSDAGSWKSRFGSCRRRLSETNEEAKELRRAAKCQRRSKSTPLAGVKMHHLMRFSPALAVVPVVHRRDPRCFV